MYDIDQISVDLAKLRNALREAGRETAGSIETAQSEADRNGVLLAERLDRIHLAEAEELARHAERMADIRQERDAAIAEHKMAAGDLSARIRTVALRLVPQKPALAVAAE